jgi:serine protease AprX
MGVSPAGRRDQEKVEVPRRKMSRRIVALLLVGASAAVWAAGPSAPPDSRFAPLARAASAHRGWSRVIVQAHDAASAASLKRFLVRQLGYDGSGIGIAIVDSGVTAWHDDLAGPAGQRVTEFVDFVNLNPSPYDDLGHGTHVAGIVAGNGFDSSGARAGIAPGAHLLVMKTLDANGTGRVSDVISAIGHAVARKDALNIRVLNLSISAAVHEPPESDPLTLAAKRAVEAGIVVVAAAGNTGRDAHGRALYGGITAPGNAPWVLTVGASNHHGTIARSDDTQAPFSGRGPAAVTNTAKPDILAPGVGIESLSDPTSALYTTRAGYLLGGTIPTAYLPYLSLSGTSMSAPVVTGTVALMLQANPALTPNAVKAILQYTAESSAGVDHLTQGAGFLNAEGAVALARHFASPASTAYPSTSRWSAHVIWGNHLLRHGRLVSSANAWVQDVTWGAPRTPAGENVWWGVSQDQSKDRWGVKCGDAACSVVQWGFGKAQNVVWGTACGGKDCSTTWTAAASTVAADPSAATVVWGSTTVWGSTEGDTVVWGSTEGDTVVWGSGCSDPSCDVLWNPDLR